MPIAAVISAHHIEDPNVLSLKGYAINLRGINGRPDGDALARLLTLMTLLLSCLASLVIQLERIDGMPRWAHIFFYQQFLFEDYVQAITMLLAFSLALVLPTPRQWVARLAALIGEYPKCTCVIVFIILVLGAHFVYLAHPFTMDEYAPQLQARAFAQGSLTVRYDPGLLNWLLLPQTQGNFLLVNRNTGEAMSAYWPGLALLMSPFAFFHLEALLNPLLSVLALWLIGDLAVQAGTDGRCRGWAMLAALASPVFTINAMSFYAMPGLLALNLLYLWLLLRPGWQSALAAGMVGSVALALVNPLPHAMTGLPCMVWLLLDSERRRRLFPLMAGYLPLTLALMIGWPMLTTALGMPHSGGEHANADGFVSGWLARVKEIFVTPSDWVLQLRWHSAWKVWIWSCPGLLLLPFFLRRRGTIFWLMVSSFALTFMAYFFVPYSQGYGWGYRYIHPAWGGLPVCGGVWLALAQGKLREFARAAVLAGLLATPVFLWQTRTVIADTLAQRFTPPDDGRWLVFVAMNRNHPTDALIQNYPGPQRIVYMASRGKTLDRQLMQDIAPLAVEVAHDSRGSMWRTHDD
jgi:hypothetical protein